MIPSYCSHAIAEWPDGRRATLLASEDRTYWLSTEDESLNRLNQVLRMCYDRDLSLEQLATKCLAHEFCPPAGRLVSIQRDGWRPAAAGSRD